MFLHDRIDPNDRFRERRRQAQRRRRIRRTIVFLLVAGVIAALGLPQRLRDVDVKQEQLDRIAELSMHDRWIHTNPRRIDGPPVVRELLDAAW